MKTKDIGIKILVEAVRIILGITFMFSGFVKAVDPLGTVYQIEDYMTAFGLSFFSALAVPAAFGLCALEFLMGVFMLLGIYRRWNSRLIMLTMCFMTPLTLYLAIANPVADCGCFGDAIHISNWQTFYKNIALTLCAVVVLKYHERIGNFFTGKTYWLAFLYCILFIGVFLFRNYYLDPLFDFRPYTAGADIRQLMQVEKGKEQIEESILVYEKGGVEEKFTEDTYPWEDESWKFVRMETKVIREGEKAPMGDFSINALTLDKELTSVIESQDVTEAVLSDSNYVFLMISPSLAKMNGSRLSNLEDVAHYADDHRYGFYCLTASVTDDIMVWEKDQVSNFNFAQTDERVLKTILRTNPGLLLLKNGVIINKWADTYIPGEEDLTKPLDQLTYSTTKDGKTKDKRNLIYIIIIFALPLLILKVPDVFFYRNKNVAKGADRVDTDTDTTTDTTTE